MSTLNVQRQQQTALSASERRVETTAPLPEETEILTVPPAEPRDPHGVLAISLMVVLMALLVLLIVVIAMSM